MREGENNKNGEFGGGLDQNGLEAMVDSKHENFSEPIAYSLCLRRD